MISRNNFLRWDKKYQSIISSIDLSGISGATVADIPVGFVFSDDHIYFSDTGNNGLLQYTFSTLYDLSTLSYAGFFDTQSLTPAENTPFGIYVSSDGVDIAFIGQQNDRVYFGELLTPYDITTYDELGASSITVDNEPKDLHFANGTYFITGEQNNRVYAGYDGSPDSFNITETSTPRGLTMNADGSKMWILGQSEQTIFEYDLSTEFDITTSVLSNSYFINVSGLSSLSYTNGYFYSISGTTFYQIETPLFVKESVKYGNELQYDINSYAISLLPEDVISFYANIDVDNSLNFASWRLDLVNKNGDTIAYDIGLLTKDTISGNDFRFYSENLEIPSVSSGCYKFAIMVDSDTLYESNIFNISSISPYTYKIRYRNSVNILNFNYESLTSFKNEFRISLVKRSPTYSTARTGYILVDGSFNPVRTTTGSIYEFITEAYSDLDHEAWNSATIQALEIYNEETGQWEYFKRGSDTSYEVEWQNNYPTADGSIRLEQTNTYSSNKNV